MAKAKKSKFFSKFSGKRYEVTKGKQIQMLESFRKLTIPILDEKECRGLVSTFRDHLVVDEIESYEDVDTGVFKDAVTLLKCISEGLQIAEKTMLGEKYKDENCKCVIRNNKKREEFKEEEDEKLQKLIVDVKSNRVVGFDRNNNHTNSYRLSFLKENIEDGYIFCGSYPTPEDEIIKGNILSFPVMTSEEKEFYFESVERNSSFGEISKDDFEDYVSTKNGAREFADFIEGLVEKKELSDEIEEFIEDTNEIEDNDQEPCYM